MEHVYNYTWSPKNEDRLSWRRGVAFKDGLIGPSAKGLRQSSKKRSPGRCVKAGASPFPQSESDEPPTAFPPRISGLGDRLLGVQFNKKIAWRSVCLSKPSESKHR